MREAVRRRLAARSPACARTLEVAAIIGREFDAGLVATATGEPALATLEALDEAIDAGLVEAAEGPGRFRFVHALVRDAVEATLGAASLPSHHRVVAEAVATYHGTGDEALPELARHWSVAAALGEREVAAGWCERAADAADRRMAWEEAARLYERAAELTGADLDPRCATGDCSARRGLASSATRWRSPSTAPSPRPAVRHLDQPLLVAEACLLAEGRGGPMMLPLLALAEEALADIDADDHALRARLLGLIAAIAFYVDPAASTSAAWPRWPRPIWRTTRSPTWPPPEPGRWPSSNRSTPWSAWRWPPASAGRAERSVGPRSPSGSRSGASTPCSSSAASRRRSPSAPCSARTSMRSACRCRALAPAAGRGGPRPGLGPLRGGDGVERAGRGAVRPARGGPRGRAMHLGFLVMVHLHTGDDPAFGRDLLAIPHELAPLFLGDLPRMQPIIGHLRLGDLESARSLYDQLRRPTGGRPRRSSASTCTSSGCGWRRGWIARRLPALLAVIEEHRGVHAGTSAGGVSYMGPVELWLGTGRAALGELDSAVEDLRAALAATSTNGARGFVVQAAAELATALLGGVGPGPRRGRGAGRHVAGHRGRPRHGAVVGPPRGRWSPAGRPRIRARSRHASSKSRRSSRAV